MTAPSTSNKSVRATYRLLQSGLNVLQEATATGTMSFGESGSDGAKQEKHNLNELAIEFHATEHANAQPHSDLNAHSDRLREEAALAFQGTKQAHEQLHADLETDCRLQKEATSVSKDQREQARNAVEVFNDENDARDSHRWAAMEAAIASCNAHTFDRCMALEFAITESDARNSNRFAALEAAIGTERHEMQKVCRMVAGLRESLQQAQRGWARTSAELGMSSQVVADAAAGPASSPLGTEMRIELQRIQDQLALKLQSSEVRSTEQSAWLERVEAMSLDLEARLGEASSASEGHRQQADCAITELREVQRFQAEGLAELRESLKSYPSALESIAQAATGSILRAEERLSAELAGSLQDASLHQDQKIAALRSYMEEEIAMLHAALHEYDQPDLAGMFGEVIALRASIEGIVASTETVQDATVPSSAAVGPAFQSGVVPAAARSLVQELSEEIAALPAQSNGSNKEFRVAFPDSVQGESTKEGFEVHGKGNCKEDLKALVMELVPVKEWLQEHLKEQHRELGALRSQMEATMGEHRQELDALHEGLQTASRAFQKPDSLRALTQDLAVLNWRAERIFREQSEELAWLGRHGHQPCLEEPAVPITLFPCMAPLEERQQVQALAADVATLRVCIEEIKHSNMEVVALFRKTKNTDAAEGNARGPVSLERDEEIAALRLRSEEELATLHERLEHNHVALRASIAGLVASTASSQDVIIHSCGTVAPPAERGGVMQAAPQAHVHELSQTLKAINAQSDGSIEKFCEVSTDSKQGKNTKQCSEVHREGSCQECLKADLDPVNAWLQDHRKETSDMRAKFDRLTSASFGSLESSSGASVLATDFATLSTSLTETSRDLLREVDELRVEFQAANAASVWPTTEVDVSKCVPTLSTELDVTQQVQ